MLKLVEEKMEEFIISLENEHITTLFKTLPCGKKLRSKLILNITNNSKDAVILCAIVELIHLASLLHDDVIDEAKTRRGEDSFNAINGDKNAIMLGDILYSKAFYELTNLPFKVAKIVSNAVSKLSIGEMQDVTLSQNFNQHKKLYLEMIYNKTASLIEASSLSAAILAQKDEVSFKEYGKNLGLAFQIVDDILDITQDSKTLGKPALHDFKEGKTTLPYIYLYDELNDEDKTKLIGLFQKDLTLHEASWIKEKMIKTGVLKRSVKEAKELGLRAIKAIKDEDLPKLEEVVSAMIDREF